MSRSTNVNINKIIKEVEILKQAVSRSLEQDTVLLNLSSSDEDKTQNEVLNYLLGKDMSRKEEDLVCKHFANELDVNALGKLVDCLKISTMAENKNSGLLEKLSNVAEQVSVSVNKNSILRLKASSVELNESGIKIVTNTKYQKELCTPTFFLEYLPPRAVPIQKHLIVSLSSKNMHGKVISFGQEKIHSLSNSVRTITFNIYFRYNNRTPKVLLGSAEFNLPHTRMINLPHVVIDICNDCDVIGFLTLSAYVEEELNTASGGISSHSKTTKKTTSSETISSIRSSPRPAASDILQEKAVLLRNIINITQCRGFDDNYSNLYVIFKGFWLDDVLKSNVEWNKRNPCFSFYQNVPILISPYFLQRSRGNYGILEIWDASQAEHVLVGIAKLSLQTFYLAFRYADITEELLSAPQPVISNDHWVSVVHPISGEKHGEILILLAVGTTEQVARLELKRGLRIESETEIACNLEQIQPLAESRNTDSSNFKLEIKIIKVTEFMPMEKFASDGADCFIDYKLPVSTSSGVTFKTYISDMTLCTLEPKFSCHHTHISDQPISQLVTAGIIFKLSSRLYAPSVHDIQVAQACLSKSLLMQLEQEKMEKSMKLTLPLTNLYDSHKGGFLIIELNYTNNLNNNKLENEAKSTQTNIELVDFIEKDESSLDDKLLDEEEEEDSDLTEITPLPIDLLSPDELIQAQFDQNVNDFLDRLSQEDANDDDDDDESSEETDTIPERERLQDIIEELTETETTATINNDDVESVVSRDRNVDDDVVEINREEQNKSIVEKELIDCIEQLVVSELEQEPLIDNQSEKHEDNEIFNHYPSTLQIHLEVKEAKGLPCLNVTLYGILMSSPTTYVTVEKHQDDLLISPVIFSSCNPCWDWHCNTQVPSQLLVQSNQHLILKLWHPCDIQKGADPSKDSILCFAAIDITDLLSGLPQISGWFKLINFAGQYCGEIKVCITPLESLTPFHKLKERIIAREVVLEEPEQDSVEESLYLPTIDVEDTFKDDVMIEDNPFMDMSSADIEARLQEKIFDLDALTTELIEKVRNLDVKHEEVFIDHPEGISIGTNTEDKINPVESEEEEEEEEDDDDCSSSNSVDSDVARLVSKLNCETFQKLVEQLEDAAKKHRHRGKPDYVCQNPQILNLPSNSDSSNQSSQIPSVPRETPEGENDMTPVKLVPADNNDKVSESEL